MMSLNMNFFFILYSCLIFPNFQFRTIEDGHRKSLSKFTDLALFDNYESRPQDSRASEGRSFGEVGKSTDSRLLENRSMNIFNLKEFFLFGSNEITVIFVLYSLNIN